MNINFDNVFSNIPDGKRSMRTDLTDFIASMLYGYHGIRGHEYGGSMTFSTRGKAYTITRYFGITEDNDKCEIVDAETGRVVNELSENVGRQLFSLDQESFARTSIVNITRIGNYDDSDTICKEAIKLIENTKEANTVDKAINNINHLIESLSETNPDSTGFAINNEINKNEEIISHEPHFRELKAQLNQKIEKETASRDSCFKDQSVIGKQIKDAEDRAVLIKKAFEYRSIVNDYKLAEIAYSSCKKSEDSEVLRLNDNLKACSDLIGRWNSRISISNALGIKQLNLRNRIKEIEGRRLSVPKPEVQKPVTTVTTSEPTSDNITLNNHSDNGTSNLNLVLTLFGIGGLVVAVVLFIASLILKKSLFVFEAIFAILGLVLITIVLLKDNSVSSDTDTQKASDASDENMLEADEADVNKSEEIPENGMIEESSVASEGIDPVDYSEINNLKEEIASDAAYIASIDNEVANYLKQNDYDFDENSAGGFLQYIQTKHIEAISTAMAQNKMHDSLAKKFEEAKAIKENYESNNDVSVLVNISEKEIPVDTTNLRIKFNAISDNLEDIDNILWAYDEEMDGINVKLDTINTAKVKLEELHRMKNANIAKIDVLKEAASYLHTSHKNMIDKYLHQLLNQYSRYCGIIVNGSDNKFAIETGRSDTSNPKLNEICMRLALADVVYKGEKPFIIMNDCFSDLDMIDTRKAMRLLDDISGKYQVIYYAIR